MARSASETTAAEKILAAYALLLFGGRKHSLPELAQRLGCSKQTVMRIMERIEAEAGVRLRSEKIGVPRWYWLEAPPKRPTVTLSPEEIQHLLLCRDLVWHLLPARLRDELERTVGRTTALLSSPEDRGRATTPVALAHPRGHVDYSEHQEVLRAILDAITRRRLCRVSYQTPWQPEPRQHLVAPLKLVAYNEALYLRCRMAWPDGLPKPDYEPTLLAVHRCRAVEVTGWASKVVDRGEPPEVFGLVEGETIRARIAFRGWAAPFVRERVWSADQRFEEADGHLVLELTSQSRSELVTWVLGFGPRAEVLAPADLRAEVAAKLAEALGRYRGG